MLVLTTVSVFYSRSLGSRQGSPSTESNELKSNGQCPPNTVGHLNPNSVGHLKEETGGSVPQMHAHLQHHLHQQHQQQQQHQHQLNHHLEHSFQGQVLQVLWKLFIFNIILFISLGEEPWLCFVVVSNLTTAVLIGNYFIHLIQMKAQLYLSC